MGWLPVKPFIKVALMAAMMVRSVRLIVMSSVVVEPLISSAVKPSALINCSFLIYKAQSGGKQNS